MKKWGWIELVAEAITGVATIVGLIAGAKNAEDLDDQIRRVINEDKEET